MIEKQIYNGIILGGGGYAGRQGRTLGKGVGVRGWQTREISDAHYVIY